MPGELFEALCQRVGVYTSVQYTATELFLCACAGALKSLYDCVPYASVVCSCLAAVRNRSTSRTCQYLRCAQCEEHPQLSVPVLSTQPLLASRETTRVRRRQLSTLTPVPAPAPCRYSTAWALASRAAPPWTVPPSP